MGPALLCPDRGPCLFAGAAGVQGRGGSRHCHGSASGGNRHRDRIHGKGWIKGMTGKIGAAIVIFAYGIILFVLVRPGSQGPKLISASGKALSSVIKAGTGGGTWSKK